MKEQVHWLALKQYHFVNMYLFHYLETLPNRWAVIILQMKFRYLSNIKYYGYVDYVEVYVLCATVHLRINVSLV